MIFLKGLCLLLMGLTWMYLFVTLVTNPILFLLGADKDITLSLTEKVGGFKIILSAKSSSNPTMVMEMVRSWLTAIARCCCRQREFDCDASIFLMEELVA